MPEKTEKYSREVCGIVFKLYLKDFRVCHEADHSSSTWRSYSQKMQRMRLTFLLRSLREVAR